MNEEISHRTRKAIRRLFAKRRSFTVADVSRITGVSVESLERRLDADELVTVPNAVSLLPWSEVVHIALGVWPVEVIFDALGEDSLLLPPLLRPVAIKVSLPKYQALMLDVLARQEQLDASAFLQNYLLDLASSADHMLLEQEIPGFLQALRFPDE
jgi:hypothetical protein